MKLNLGKTKEIFQMMAAGGVKYELLNKEELQKSGNNLSLLRIVQKSTNNLKDSKSSTNFSKKIV